ncbi:ABC transporter ATP-binding protein [Thioflexithrix psekupsensis]|uniref:ABC transporter domain-containing protein n=1 Tax=Thioflexithrix psekupsensis TaxID=1570016 RepID=A0A251XBP2_9GAMM|nr:ABC transporter ATP-binding protein [Thioflexithrix psekupsensis]OUD15723.1 hypothetical protein TPSD3_04210 [Thioflexithrix psekupsensis]
MTLHDPLHLHIAHKAFSPTFIPVLSQLQLTIHAGEFIAFIGPSGAGKSTLLNIVAGLDRQFSGTVMIGQQNLHQGSQAQLRLAMMFQETRLMPWLTVLENLLLVLKKETHARSRAMQVLERVGLTAQANAYPQQLSGGMQRRVALARAFVVQPELLLMDEPFISVDAPTVQQLHTQLLQLWQQHQATILFVTHHFLEALLLADSVVFLSAAPAQIIHVEAITLPRPRELEQIERMAKQLLQRYPQLLSGQLGV